MLRAGGSDRHAEWLIADRNEFASVQTQSHNVAVTEFAGCRLHGANQVGLIKWGQSSRANHVGSFASHSNSSNSPNPSARARPSALFVKHKPID